MPLCPDGTDIAIQFFVISPRYLKLMIKRSIYILAAFFLLTAFSRQPASTVKIARLKYNGGGNWYVSPTSMPNLISFCNKNLGTNMAPNEDIVESDSKEIFNYPFVHVTGNGLITFSTSEADNIRNYLIAGGFLNINDSYGLDPYIRIAMKKVFPELSFIELPYNHPIYHQKYPFPNGLPKIHEHDGKPAQGFGLIYNGRLVCFYNFECDLGDGWEDPEVHKDPENKRQEALRMGADIIQYVFNQH
jgi:hypothetical protein